MKKPGKYELNAKLWFRVKRDGGCKFTGSMIGINDEKHDSQNMLDFPSTDELLRLYLEQMK